ncbi:MAG TPA: fumarylacetoacetate hydrolase family protein [Candidatus Bathyarchaeia archaeon]|nr:fumarylacetoacetate hydrolase family protein [Candidatus Bathyarchaeia archaeon]
MKLVAYTTKKAPNKTRTGLLWGEWILDIDRVTSYAEKLNIHPPRSIRSLPATPTIQQILSKSAKLLDDLQSVSWRIFNRIPPEHVHRFMTRTDDARIKAPIPNPPTLRDFYAFEDHVKAARARRGLSMSQEWYEFPAFYYSNPNVIYGPEADIPYPSYTKTLDYELEIACVIGRGGIDIPEAEAESYIAGYTIMNDWSARDVQVGEMKIGLGPAKAKDFATSIGPWLVTTDELQDRRTGPGKFNLEMTAKVNGKQLSMGNVDQMHWTFPQMIARASQSVQLQPGEVFGSGTVGTGSLLELGPEVHPWLKPGDTVELEIERLGVLRNKVIRREKRSE